MKISQWLFPDTVDFHTNITSCDESEINLSMEKYAKAALCLLMPHRSVDDLKSTGTVGRYTKRLQEQYDMDMQLKTAGRKQQMFTDSNIDFLQNIQSCGRNSLRYKIESDELQECTEPWKRADRVTGEDSDDYEDVQDDDEDFDFDFEAVCYEDIVACMDEPLELGLNDEDPDFLKVHLNGFSFDTVRDKGAKGCGYKKDLETPVRQSGTVLNGIPFICTTAALNNGVRIVRPNVQDFKKKYTVNAVVKVMFSKTSAKFRRGFVRDGPGVNLSDANAGMTRTTSKYKELLRSVNGLVEDPPAWWYYYLLGRCKFISIYVLYTYIKPMTHGSPTKRAFESITVLLAAFLLLHSTTYRKTTRRRHCQVTTRNIERLNVH